MLSRHNGKRKPKRFGNASDSDDIFADMPELTDISNSEDEGGMDDSGDDSSDDDYDEDDEEELKRHQREAIDRSLEVPDVLDPNNEKYQEERKKNPLLSLLSNLRGEHVVLRTSQSHLSFDLRPTILIHRYFKDGWGNHYLAEAVGASSCQEAACEACCCSQTERKE